MKNNISPRNCKFTRNTCYYTYLAMSSIFVLPPILFVTFREMYGLSYTLLGTLVLLNFCTQLAIDLIFSFFSKHFNVRKTLFIMPLLTSLGLIIYAVVPLLLPQYAFIGLALGTVIFSVAAGLCEVLLSPLVAALPSENHERDMSTLHSLYAYGILSVIIISTIYLKIFGNENWMYLTLFLALLPLISSFLFGKSFIPDINLSQNESKRSGKRNGTALLLFALCIFLGSAAENAMTNWISSYLENAVGVSKALGDILGMAMFAVLLGLGRSLYAKYGKHISRILLLGMMGAMICYLVVGLTNNIIISVIACAFTGFCTSMLWPGTLIMMEERLPGCGVVAYALMAAGGDFGASLVPQLLGVIVDKVSLSSWAIEAGERLSLAPEQIGLKTGMLISAIFPLMGIAVLLIIRRYFLKKQESKQL